MQQIDFSISNTAPKTIEEIGDRTFRIKERLWAWNTIGNLKHIWCSKHLGYPKHFIPEIGMITQRKAKLEKDLKENTHEKDLEQTTRDIESLEVKICEFVKGRCEECVEKQNFRLSALGDKEQGECICLGGGPSVLDYVKGSHELYPHIVKQIKDSGFPVLAVDHILIPCLKAGIIPKYVLAADGHEHVKAYFEDEIVRTHSKDIVLISNVQIHPDVADLWVSYGGKIMWYNVALDPLDQSKSLSRYLFHITNDNVISVPWGHVGGYAFGLGYMMGYNPVVLMGIDLGFAPSDNIKDTPYWNPYYKAVVKNFILADLKMEDKDLQKPENMEKFLKLGKEKYGYDDQHEYKSTSEHYYEPAVQETIKQHFHYYDNPYNHHVWHDNIFKAYKDIMFSFMVANPQCQVIQSSDYTTYFPQPCDQCRGEKHVNEQSERKVTCYKCKVERVEKVVGKQIDCPKCKALGIMGSNIRCMSLQDYLNSKIKV